MENIFPKFEGGVSRQKKESALGQHGRVIWLFGLSGSGKSTLATALEHRLAAEGRHTVLLDGDNLRAGLNAGLGFSDVDRTENLRRAAEVAKLFVQSGSIVLCAFITPLRVQRDMIRKIIGPDDLVEIFLSASYATCQRRDTKGLYAKAAQGTVRQFTGKDSGFELPGADEEATLVDSESISVEVALDRLHAIVTPRIRLG